MEQPNGKVRILGLAGSLRTASYNRMLLRAAVELAPSHVELTAWQRLKTIPPFDEDDEPTPGLAVAALRDAIRATDVLLVITPEYNGSLPGQLKNALDWASRPREDTVLRGKPAAVIGASPSPGGARTAQADARRVLGRAGAQVIKHEFAVARAYASFDADGRLVDEKLRAGLRSLLLNVADEIRDRRRVPELEIA